MKIFELRWTQLDSQQLASLRAIANGTTADPKVLAQALLDLHQGLADLAKWIQLIEEARSNKRLR